MSLKVNTFDLFKSKTIGYSYLRLCEKYPNINLTILDFPNVPKRKSKLRIG